MNTVCDVEINLGREEVARRLFAYPNLGHESESLQSTISHYISDSLNREGLSNAAISVDVSEDACAIRITGLALNDAEVVKTRYQAFFDAGLTGLQDIDAFAALGKLDPAWKFLLPLGTSLAYARAVEVMDFPPVTLIQKQDYLNSKTTARWWALLGLNGVSTEELARYSCILDIVPVAAPAGDGTKLEASGIYGGPFDSYSDQQLELLSRAIELGARRPLIALGMPIRTWIQRIWGKSLQILDVGRIDLKQGGSCPVIASNHPSLFYYAVNSNTGPDAPEKNLAAGLAVMKQDIVASAWHARMGRDPASDPIAVLAESKAAWQGKDVQLLELVKKQAGIPEPMALPSTAQTIDKVRSLQPSAEALVELERQFYIARNQGALPVA